MTQSDLVKTAIANLGGVATLRDIYEEILRMPDYDWATKTPDATIRRIVRHTEGIYVVRKGVYTIDPSFVDSSYLYRKLVDKSLLTEGFSIPRSEQPLFHALSGGRINVGESRVVKFLIDGEEFECEFKNQPYDRNVYSNHADVMQFRYSSSSPLAKKFRQLFPLTSKYVEAEMKRKRDENDKRYIKYPEEMREFIILNSTPLADVFVLDVETRLMKDEVKEEVKMMNELDFETSFVPRIDDEATIVEKEGIIRMRQLDRSIGDSLKKLYDYRCQMTGEKIGEEQGGLVVEAHHIAPFTKSLNNNTSNIIILSPNYHRIVHKANPEWIASEKAFVFPNGLKEIVQLNKHL